MSTYMPKDEQIVHKWYIIDASDKVLGRVAAQAASILRGKHKTDFTPHQNCGDSVVIINAGKAVLTGKKLQQKYYRRHTGWVGGLKEIRYDRLMETRPELAMELAIKRMLPNNKLASKAMARLRVFGGSEHNLQAQNPCEFPC